MANPIAQMRTLIIFKRKAEGKLAVKKKKKKKRERERGVRKENEVRAIINKCREENLFRKEK